MARGKLKRKSRRMPVRSFRCADRDWEHFARHCQRLGTSTGDRLRRLIRIAVEESYDPLPLVDHHG